MVENKADPRDGEAWSQLLTLLRARAVLRGDFVLSSGQRSSYYLDARLVTLSGDGSALVGQVFLDALSRTDVVAVAGLALGADPIVTATIVTAWRAGRHLDGLIVRKEAKQHGTTRRIEGPFAAGMRVAVVDDTLTTGGSSLQAVKALVDAGANVAGVWALIDREQGAQAIIEGQGLAFHALYRASEILA